MMDTTVNKPIVFVVRENVKTLDVLCKKVRLFNGIVMGLILVTKLYNTLVEIEKKNQKGE